MAALVDLLADFDIPEISTRAMLSAVHRKGLLNLGRRGRRSEYSLSEFGRHRLNENIRQVFTSNADTNDWDGQWTFVTFSLPERTRSTRHLLRRRLLSEGFAVLFGGVWVAPGRREEIAARLLQDLNIDLVSVVVGRSSDLLPNGNPLRAWDLQELRGHHDEFLRTFGPFTNLATADLSNRKALQIRTALMDAFRDLSAREPNLPNQLLPDDWPRPKVRRLFIELYDMLATMAEARVRESFVRHDPETAMLVSHHTSVTVRDLFASNEPSLG